MAKNLLERGIDLLVVFGFELAESKIIWTANDEITVAVIKTAGSRKPGFIDSGGD